MKKSVLKARSIALNGILGALAVICLLLAAVLPTGRISMYSLSSFFIAVSIIEGGIGIGWIFYLVTGLLAFIVIPEKSVVILYVIFFGIYGIVKYYVEKINNIVVEYMLKFVYFNACVTIALFVIKGIFQFDKFDKAPFWLVLIIAEVVFFLYDFVYTLFINYYVSKIRSKLK